MSVMFTRSKTLQTTQEWKYCIYKKSYNALESKLEQNCHGICCNRNHRQVMRIPISVNRKSIFLGQINILIDIKSECEKHTISISQRHIDISHIPNTQNLHQNVLTLSYGQMCGSAHNIMTYICLQYPMVKMCSNIRFSCQLAFEL